MEATADRVPPRGPHPVVPINAACPTAVAEFVHEKFHVLFPTTAPQWLDKIFEDVTAMFEGRHPDYAAIDLHYHDFAHTLQATVCLVLILANRHRNEAEPRLSAREFETAVAAALLHDTGYLRLRSDTNGTGAKYAFVHELRSCAFAAAYLPTLGATLAEIDRVVSAISCTGPRSVIRRTHFHGPLDRIIGCAVATADYLAQMAAPDYVDRLPSLYAEFEESHAFLHTPPSGRQFTNANDLIRNTPAFWRHIVLPKLNDEFDAVYHYLGTPYTDGPNLYLEAVEDNMAKIKNLVASGNAA